jgi:hypothetical protein
VAGPYSRSAWLYAAAAGALLVVAVVSAMMAPLNTDAAWMLVEARRLLEGERLYVDMMETNPPLIVWLSALPALLTTMGGVSDQRVVGLSIASLLTIATVLVLRVMGREPAMPRFVQLQLLGSFLVTTGVFCAWDTGQREQIAAIMAFPYTVLAARAVAGERSSAGLAAGCGALAAVGFAIKPFFLGAFAAIELVVLAAAGWKRAFSRIDVYIIAGFQLGYLLVILVATPEYVDRIVPAVLATYGAYGNGIRAVIATNEFRLPALIGVLALTVSAIPAPALARAYTRVLGAATLGWLAGYVSQGKGWPYHFIPVMVYSSVAVAATGAQLVAVVRTIRQQPIWLRAGSTAAALVLVCVSAWTVPAVWSSLRANLRAILHRGQGGISVMADVVNELAVGEPIYALSTNMAPAFPVANLAGAQWPYHYHFLWLIPGLYPGRTGTPIPYRTPEAQGPMERAFFETVVTDLQRTPPRLLIVDRSRDQQGMAYGRPFDFVRYFSGSKEFVDLMRRYRLAEVLGPYAIYERVR